MSVVRKVRAVEKVFMALDSEISSFQEYSKISCLTGCGKCCFKPDIEATPLEFLPLALDLLENREIESFYDRLISKEDSYCILFNQHSKATDKGACAQYHYRGLICRLFGYSAMKGRDGLKKYVTCKVIKESQADQVAQVQEAIVEGAEIPLMSDYYFRLRSIDPDLGTTRYPINEAMRKALEHVMAYYSYRKRPSTRKNNQAE